MVHREEKKTWVTLSGLPLTFDFEWPFHKSTSGADFQVLHTDIRIVGTDLHAPVAVNLSATVREVLPSLDPKDAEAPVINALRKEIDHKQVEFTKSGKLLPIAFSSRHYDFKRQKWVFGKATDETIAAFLEQKVYWQARISRGSGVPSPEQIAAARVWIADPTEAQYLQTTTAHLVEVAQRLLGAKGLLRMDGEWAEASPALPANAEKFESAMRSAIEELEKKHAFERG
jgi:hypothetical protein